MKPQHYQAQNHINNLTRKPYYRNLMVLRNVVSRACDDYFHSLSAPKVDLFMVAKGVSSPMGKGSDSLPIPFDLGKQHVYLVDSAQFGMEPLVQSAFELVYCYLPSFRGEDADYRHLNQFYHCEAELRGSYDQAITIAEGLVKAILSDVLSAHSKKVFTFEKTNIANLEEAINTKFLHITFDEAISVLEKNKCKNAVEVKDYGRVLTSLGELKLCEILSDNKVPLWITHYDRDVVPFYQKPDPENPERVLNADLIFPAINGGFGGEIVGLGERQNTADGLLESMNRQNVHDDAYGWYIELRNNSDYHSTSGFGLGIERLLAWMLGLPNIWDAALYPVIKDEEIYY